MGAGIHWANQKGIDLKRFYEKVWQGIGESKKAA
jgi:hypothetical protein